MLTVPCYSIHFFTWTKQDGHLRGACDRSDLPGVGWSKMYNDSCDEGFSVAGRTETRTFCLIKVEKDREGDVTAWVFADVDHRRFNDEIRIFND